jgi:cysteine desulfurase / selenocysteine lyase
MINADKVKENFPSLTLHPEIVYLDSAATTQTPQCVLDSVQDYYQNYHANVSRGSYSWSNKSTKKVDDVREKVKSFISANRADEIVFTSGATQSSNTLAYSWGVSNLKNGDEILLCLDDHRSSILPWLMVKDILLKQGINIKLIDFKIHPHGDYSIEDLFSKVTKNTKLVILSHIHNVYGLEMEVELIRSRLGSDVLVFLDASQSIGHTRVNVTQLGVDSLYFSGHKMFAQNGIGILWINKKIHNQISPFMVGGNSAVHIDFKKLKILTKFMPGILEAGTPNISGIISLGASIDFINSVGIENIGSYIFHLTRYLVEKLMTLDNIVFLPGPAIARCEGYGIVTFRITNHSASDVGFLLDDNNIFVRTGGHCVALDTNAGESIRVSLHIYNTKKDIDKLIDVLREFV